jgi:hypothetical protein
LLKSGRCGSFIVFIIFNRPIKSSLLTASGAAHNKKSYKYAKAFPNFKLKIKQLTWELKQSGKKEGRRKEGTRAETHDLSSNDKRIAQTTSE